MPAHLASVTALKRAIEIAEQIEKLEAELASILEPYGAKPASLAAAPNNTKLKGRRKRKVSPEARERMAAAARARWARAKAS